MAGVAAAAADGVVNAPPDQPAGRLLWPLLAVAAVVLLVLPVADTPLAAQPSFVPVMLAVVCCFDVLSVALLVGQFRDTGAPRALALSWAYLFSLVTVLGWAAAFPGVFGTPAPLGRVASTAPWLWVVWHTAFPVLLAVALAPWPARAERCLEPERRRALAWATLGASAGAAGLLVAAVVAYADRLPVVIHGTNTTEMTRIAGPAMLPVVVLATVVTGLGGWRRGGPERWAALAAAASLGDVVLTLFSYYRYSLGWYAGRTLTIVSAGVILVALLGEFNLVKRRLAREGERLRMLLDRTDALERLQRTLLTHMSDGVVMQAASGEIVASNPAAEKLLGLSAEQLRGHAPLDPGWQAVRPDGTTWHTADMPPMATLSTGVGQRDQIVGVHTPDGALRWLSVDTAPARDGSGSVDYVVSSITDVTERQSAALAAAQEQRAQRDRIERILAGGGPSIVFQPIVELTTGTVMGAEALARFQVQPPRPPDRWFADAAQVGLGVELELSAIAAALAQLDRLPANAYVSLNAGPATVTCAALPQLLSAGCHGRVVLELTEHAGVEDYAALEDALTRLRALGVRLAVDDAGAGFASLRHILNLDPDIIKLDIGLVRGIDVDPARRALAASLLAFGQEIGADVIAEGIENAAEHGVVRRLGIRYGQGYHLGRPAPLPLPSAAPAAEPGRLAHTGG